MNRSAVVFTRQRSSRDAGRHLAQQLAAQRREPPDALIVFVSPQYDLPPFLEQLQADAKPATMVGCSSAGEFTDQGDGSGGASAVAIWSDEMEFAGGIGRGLKADRSVAAQALTASFKGVDRFSKTHSAALILTDALAGHTDELIEQLMLRTGGTYQFFGGGAGDDANFRSTQVFCGSEIVSDAAVGLEILSDKPLGIGVQHGWQPASRPLRVTAAEGSRLISLDAMPAVEAFQEHAETIGEEFDPKDPVPFFLHHILGIDTGHGFKLRVPLTIGDDGSILCAAEIPEGVTVRIMGTNSTSSAEAATKATQAALERLNGHKPGVALFFDCVATRLRLGKAFGVELEALRQALEPAAYAGCNTYGQIAKAEGQFSGFHNCTAVVCVIPE